MTSRTHQIYNIIFEHGFDPPPVWTMLKKLHFSLMSASLIPRNDLWLHFDNFFPTQFKIENKCFLLWLPSQVAPSKLQSLRSRSPQFIDIDVSLNWTLSHSTTASLASSSSTSIKTSRASTQDFNLFLSLIRHDPHVAWENFCKKNDSAKFTDEQ